MLHAPYVFPLFKRQRLAAFTERVSAGVADIIVADHPKYRLNCSQNVEQQRPDRMVERKPVLVFSTHGFDLHSNQETLPQTLR